jgi:hypothetical protein
MKVNGKMTLKDLIDKSNWEQVSESLLKVYPDQEKNIQGYEYVFEHLKTLTPKDSKMVIFQKKVTMENDPFIKTKEEEWVDIFGKNGTMSEHDETKEETYALEFVEWLEWLGMEIDEESMKEFGELETLVRCLFEMTFLGFVEEDIAEYKKELDERMKDIDEHPEKLIPAEEVFKKIKDKIDNIK